MFLVDISPSMGKECDPEGEPPTTQLKWALRFVKLKIQEMVGSVSLGAFFCSIFCLRYIIIGKRTSAVWLFLVLKVLFTTSALNDIALK
jgi:hypothetical protein